MNKKTRVLLIPSYYSATDKECLSRYVAQAKAVLDKTGIDYTESSAVSGLEDLMAIKTQAKGFEYDMVLLYIISWVDTNVIVDLLNSLKDKPIVVWSTDYFISEGKKTHLGALAGLLPIKGSLEQMGIGFSYLYGNPDKEELSAELSNVTDAARAVTQVKQSRIGMVGYSALGMYPGMVNPLQIKQLFGTELVPIDNYTLISLCETVMRNKTLAEKIKSFKNNFNFVDSLSAKDEKICIAMTEAIQKLITQYKLSAITLRCCFELASDFGFAPCVPLSILSDECVTSCESDIPVTLTQLLLHYLEQRPSAYVDITIIEEFRVYCACCGFGAFGYAYNGDKRIAYSDTGEHKSDLSFRRVINASRYEDGYYTLARLNFPLKRRPYLQVIIAENRNDFDAFHELGCREYPSLGLIVKQQTTHLLDKLGSQHFALIKGDMVEKLKCFCRFMGIEIEVFS